MPYTSLDDINPSLKGLKPAITLRQANEIAQWADAMASSDKPPDSPWAVAIATFKKKYRPHEGRWVRRQADGAAEASVPPRGHILNVRGIAESAIDLGLALAHSTGDVTPAAAAAHLRQLEDQLEAVDNGESIAPDELAEQPTDGGSREMPEITGSVHDYLVGEADQPQTWRFRVQRDGVRDRALLHEAWVALVSGQVPADQSLAAETALRELFELEQMLWLTPIIKLREMDVDLEAVDLAVRRAFATVFGKQAEGAAAPSSPVVSSLLYGHPFLGDAAIVRMNEATALAVQFGFEEDGTVVFAAREEWQPVRQTWVPV